MRRIGGLILSMICTAGVLQAQPVRTWVSTGGMDTNPCSKAQPCRNFAAGVAAVAPNGEVVAMDSGGYGPFTLDRPATILAPRGVHAAVAPTTGTAIGLNTPASEKVILRNLYLNSQGALTGIDVSVAGEVFLESITVNGFFKGVRAAATVVRELYIADTVVRNNGENALEFEGAADSELFVSMVRTRVEKNAGVGILVVNRAKVSAREVFSAANGTGFQSNGPDSYLMLDRCLVSGNQTGLRANGATNFAVVGSTIVHNAQGIVTGVTGVMWSRGNNNVIDNGVDGNFSFTFPPQ